MQGMPASEDPVEADARNRKATIEHDVNWNRATAAAQNRFEERTAVRRRLGHAYDPELSISDVAFV